MKISIREPGSALTHLAALFATAGAALPLLIKASGFGNNYVAAMMIYAVSLMLLYGASATYHAVVLSPAIIKIFRKLDHSMIFVLIAGTYTPVCLLVLDPAIGLPLLATVWIMALLGIGLKLLWINCPKWLSSVIYITMGWIVVLVFGPVYHTLSLGGFLWLLVGGIVYTLGGILYAIKMPEFNKRHPYFGTHEIFHLFVMAGSFCHFIFMYVYLL
ncbi:PAQR family membrane homeostasis protein TrhA [Butyrivibrio proteoclasticus]|uniref:PAQR family membrane homeostasis protein TrhA n=1 Tax=Butyrivibrio proteoclasticus TaxID=43305 RepID=UPI0009DD4D59|nr:hemolysin III family protein [Butyrivibrio proteoclasticus]